MFRPHPSLIKSEAQEAGPRHQNFFMFPQMTLIEAKGDREPLALDRSTVNLDPLPS